jgi:site-specific recombinase XerD
MKIATRGDGTESDVVATLLSHLLSVARASGHGPPQSQVCPTASALGQGWQAKFVSSLADSGLAPLTVLAYRHDVELFLKWFEAIKGGKRELADLTTADVLSYRQHLVNIARLRASTINQRLQAIRRLCAWAVNRRALKSNPAAAVKSLRMARRGQPAGLTEPEVHALLRVAGESKRGHAKRNYGLLQLLLQTGLRVSEVTSLKVGDVQVRERSGEVRVRQGKGSRERELPLNASARRAVRAYIQIRPDAQAGEPLFLSDRHRAMSPRAVQTLLQRLARRAKIERLRVTPHRMRHTFSLNYLRQNPGKLVQLAALLGHESLDTTAIYCAPNRARN